jgi:hypothetical protein
MGCRDRARPADVRALLANRDARRYLGGQTLSTVVDNALWPPSLPPAKTARRETGGRSGRGARE